jgi:elongation factor G
MGQDVRSPRGPRCIALVGPFQSGKTTLLEAILARTGAIRSAGSVETGTSVGDSSPEARRHKMGTGLTAATTSFMGDSYTFIDCPGSIEFAHDMRAVIPAVDAAVVVCEADERKLPQLQIILRELEDLGTAPTSGSARRSRPCSRHRGFRWCCGRYRSGTAT